jgi:predicted nuclease with RNAse H fold
MVITVGVDLAAEPVNTAVAVLDWSADACRVVAVVSPADDEQIVAAARGAQKIGIDCPLGWPDAFVDFVVGHRDGTSTFPAEAGADWRRGLANRLTDRVVRAEFGLTPLSVSTDRIAHPAMRAAALMSRLAAGGDPIDRSGGGVVVEAYPAASLRQWGLNHRRYKGKPYASSLAALLDALCAAAPWLDLGDAAASCRASDHCFDAVVAALTSQAASLGLTRAPTDDERDQARREGWIAVPLAPLAALDPRHAQPAP